MGTDDGISGFGGKCWDGDVLCLGLTGDNRSCGDTTTVLSFQKVHNTSCKQADAMLALCSYTASIG